MTRTIRTACPLDCTDSCVWLVDVSDDGVIREVRGDNNPYTRGFTCPKAQSQLRRHNDPKRPLHPMIRTDGKWNHISWDEALELAAESIRKSLAQHGPKSLFYYYDSGSMGSLKRLGLRFFRMLGGITEPLGSLCWAAGIQAQLYDFGYYLAHSPEDIRNSREIIIWGRNPAVTNAHLVPFLMEARKAGAHLTLVDPVKSETASFCDQWVQIRPGTDAALALAMANVIVRDGLLDVPYLASYTYGFSRYLEHIADFTPEWAEAITGLPKDLIENLASMYACSRPSAILMGYGLQRYYSGGNAVRAIDALAALTGNIGREGGGANYANGWVRSRLGSFVPPIDSRCPPRLVPRAAMGDLAALSDPPVQVLVVTGANPVNQAPDSNAIMKAFSAIPMKIVLDLRWSETCEVADLFLPVATSFEDEDLYFGSWHRHITFGEKAVEPRGEALPEREIWRRLASLLGRGDDFAKTPLQWVDELLGKAALPTLRARALKGRSVRFPGIPDVPYLDGRFFTRSGKFEFYSEQAEKDTGFPMATFLPPETGAFRGVPSETALYQAQNPPPFPVLRQCFRRKDCRWRTWREKPWLKRAWATDGRLFLESKEGRMLVELREARNIGEDVALVYEGGSSLKGMGANLLTPQGETDMGHGPVLMIAS